MLTVYNVVTGLDLITFVADKQGLKLGGTVVSVTVYKY